MRSPIALLRIELERKQESKRIQVFVDLESGRARCAEGRGYSALVVGERSPEN